MSYIARRTFTYNGRLIVRGQPWDPAGLRVDGSLIRTKMVEVVEEQQPAEELPETSQVDAADQDAPTTDHGLLTTDQERSADDEGEEVLPFGEPFDVSDGSPVTEADLPIREADQVEALHPTSEAAAPAPATSRKRNRQVSNDT